MTTVAVRKGRDSNWQLRRTMTPSGLTDEEAHSRLAKFGPNAMPDTSLHPLRMALEKFWAPVPWMLEAASFLK